MRNPRLPWMAPAVGLVLLLSACGGSDDPPAQAAESPAPSASAAASSSPSSSPDPSAAANLAGLPTIALASTDGAGKPAELGATQAALSGDGNFLAYRTPADDAATKPVDALATIQVRDLRSEAVVAACTSADGDAANAPCESPALSFDGQFIVFSSTATNLVAEDKDPQPDVFRKDLRSGKVVLVSSELQKAGGLATNPSISAAGRMVAYVSDGQIHLKDLGSDVATVVSRTTGGAPGDAASEGPKISADGSKVAFRSSATNLAGKPRSEKGDVLVATVATGKIVNLEKALRLKLPKGAFLLDYSTPTRLGGRIAYAVGTDDAGADKASDRSGVFVADLNKAAVIHTVRTATGGIDHAAGCAALSADGKHLAYCTLRTTRKGTKEANGYGAYLADIDGGMIQLMSGAPKGTKSPDARPAAISTDGKVVVFRSANTQRGVEATVAEGIHQLFVARPAV